MMNTPTSVRNIFEQTPLRIASPDTGITLSADGWNLPKEIVGEGEDLGLWPLITANICSFSNELAFACQRMGKPAACVSMSVSDLNRTFLNVPELGAYIKAIDLVEYEGIVREIHYRLGKVKRTIESKDVSKGLQESMLRLNSYKNVPQIKHSSLPVSLANIKRYIEKNKVPSCDVIAVYKKAATNEEEVNDIEQFESWLGTQSLIFRAKVLANLEQVNCYLIRRLDKNYKDMTYITLLANLRPKPKESIMEYSRRFIDHWKITTLSSQDAGDAFQASLPQDYQDALVFASLNKASLDDKLEYIKSWKLNTQEVMFVGNRMSRPIVQDTIAPKWDSEKGKTSKFKGECRRCHKIGHKAENCRTHIPYPSHKPSTIASHPQGKQQQQHKGGNNGKNGNYAKAESKFFNMNKDELNNYVDDSLVFLSELQAIQVPNQKKVNYITKEVELNNRKYSAMIDTGASHCFVTRAVWEELLLPKNDNTDRIMVRFANDDITTGTLMTIPFSYGEFKEDRSFVIVETLTHPVIIGLDLLHEVPQLLNMSPELPSGKIKDLLREFKANPITVEQQEEVTYYNDKDSLMNLISNALKRNLATVDKK